MELTVTPSKRNVALPQSSRAEAPRARVIRHLKGLIDRGELGHGQPVPSERTLAQLLGVNPRTVSSALQMLSDDGLIRSNGGRMRLVVAPPEKQMSWVRNAIAVITFQVDEEKVKPQSGWATSISLGALDAIRTAGKHTITLQPEQLVQEEIEHLAAQPPLGILITEISPQSERTLEMAQALGRDGGPPVVVYGGSPQMTCYDRVSSDHEAEAYQLARWLIEQGRRRILNLWSQPATGYWLPRRRAGYERALREAELEPLPDLPVGRITVEGGDRQMFEERARHTAGHLAPFVLGADPIDAVMVHTDGDLFKTSAALRFLGKEPNRDVALVGYDNYWREVPEREFEPLVPLATVDKLNHEIGGEMVRLLLDRAAGTLPDEPQLRVVAPRLIVEAQASVSLR